MPFSPFQGFDNQTTTSPSFHARSLNNSSSNTTNHISRNRNLRKEPNTVSGTSSRPTEGLLYFQIHHPVLFSRVIDLLSQFTDLVHLQMSPQKLIIHSVDTTKVVLYELALLEGKAFSYLDSALAFGSYKKRPSMVISSKKVIIPSIFKHVQEVRVGVNLKILAHTLKGLKNQDELFVLIDHSEEVMMMKGAFQESSMEFKDPEIKITVKKKQPDRVFTYSMSQFIINDHELETFEIEQFDNQVQVEILMSTNCFSQIMQDLSQMKGERLKLEIYYEIPSPCHAISGMVQNLGNTLHDSLRLFFKTSKDCLEATIEIQNSAIGTEEDIVIGFTESYSKQLQSGIVTNNTNIENESGNETLNQFEGSKNPYNVTSTISNEYSFRILSILSKASKISDQMLLQICENGPLGVLYGLEEGMGSFQFFVAPYLNDCSSDSDHE
ncbi:hypothetical protein FDP41_005986 [Naegleria fowleri]|uniref:Checkpoint protein n=1 Tax=Naegleria fowleri TaxID=5763 RepID=A0A6A5BME6_NAEFO|nr:uncharacterized protein FDP41_005986 [Naegleria fowleri]KAF0975234.1 hypothetical protein FDP41_005986 [Naegleria fowleri]